MYKNDENEPEGCPVPDVEERLQMERSLGFIIRLVLDLLRAVLEQLPHVLCRLGRGGDLGKQRSERGSDDAWTELFGGLWVHLTGRCFDLINSTLNTFYNLRWQDLSFGDAQK